MNMVEIDSSDARRVGPTLHRRSEAERYSIAMVAACPFPANHGSAASIREMSDTLSEMGHTVHIVTYRTGQEDIAIRHAKIHRTGPFQPEINAKVGPSPEKFREDWALLRLLRRVIQNERIDIIHAHNYEGALIGVAAKWITRRPLLYNAVNLMSDELAGYHFIRPAWLARAIARGLDWFVPIFPDHITAVSPELKQWFVEHGIAERKIDMVPAGIVPTMFDNVDPEKIRRRHQIKGRAIVMYAGVLNAFQRIDYLLRAFAVVAKQLPDARLVMVSPLVSEAHEREHKKLADELGISNSITWIAPHSLEDLPSYLAVADVTVISRPDCPGHPVKLLNYMLAGKPIVCFEGAAKGLRHLHDALIAPDHDCEALGNGIVTLLKDRELAARLGENARATVLANFDWRIICRRIEHIYRALVAKREPRGIQKEHHAFARLSS
ncbi:MAG: glycosyltransferase family 1 protein [Verrucomicrobia bacterium]|nr:MAG: glycosyltransferase family 1 protein [Verrucomicrobiota bacterium]